jgi:hypothetical protein
MDLPDTLYYELVQQFAGQNEIKNRSCVMSGELAAVCQALPQKV